MIERVGAIKDIGERKAGKAAGWLRFKKSSRIGAVELDFPCFLGILHGLRIAKKQSPGIGIRVVGVQGETALHSGSHDSSNARWQAIKK